MDVDSNATYRLTLSQEELNTLRYSLAFSVSNLVPSDTRNEISRLLEDIEESVG